MANFTKSAPVRREQGTIKTTSTGTTAQGGVGYKRDEKSELFMTAVTHLHGKDTFYEQADDRSQRFVALVQSVAKSDPAWLAGFIPWLRDEAGIRTASVVAAVEYIYAGAPNGRQVIAASLKRADEPAEALAYAMSTYGRRIPKALKKGLADATANLYNEMTVLKYDSSRATTRPGDVLALCHSKPKDGKQEAVFRALQDRRHGRAPMAETLEMLPLVKADLSGEKAATWERASSHGKVNWDEQIPTMGAFALLRNLRNFDKDGINSESAAAVKVRLTNADSVRKARLFPLRFLSAWKALDSVRWGDTLETGLNASLANVPVLPGRTLILWDCSGSMGGGRSNRYYSGGSNADAPALWEQAGVFALALAQRAEAADVVVYSNTGAVFPVPKGGSILRAVEKVNSVPGMWGGTSTWQVCKDFLKPNHDRVVIITDEQVGPQGFRATWGYNGAAAFDGNFDRLLGQRRAYILNVAGYEMGSAPSDRVVTFAGFNDRAFTAIEQAEKGLNGVWPWEDVL